MAFHIDIFRVVYADGRKDIVEIDYSINECIENGWLSTDGIWIRKEVDIRAVCDIGENPDGPDVVPDSQYGVDQHLNLEKQNGVWMHRATDEMCFK